MLIFFFLFVVTMIVLARNWGGFGKGIAYGLAIFVALVVTLFGLGSHSVIVAAVGAGALVLTVYAFVAAIINAYQIERHS